MQNLQGFIILVYRVASQNENMAIFRMQFAINKSGA